MQGLFGGGGPKPCDREELFGEAAGKIGSNVAKHIPGKNMAMEQLQAKGVSSTSEVGKAHAAFLERGQKINELEEARRRRPTLPGSLAHCPQTHA